MALLVLGGVLLGLRPLWQRLGWLQAQVRALQHELAIGEQVSTDVAQLQADIEATQQRLVAFDQQLPPTLALDGFLRRLDAVARQTGLQVSLIQPGVVQHGELYRALPLTITARAPFPVFFDFLVAVQAMPRLATVDALTIVSRPEEGVCDVTFTLSIYALASAHES
ncbi:MAG: hypothetical protein KatS3mg131_0120 [Candidatus Tectimicrobiota bacterium]|nr:MAG: hypothetical protein KatS3mg131_0120 [Candidatus Tectomicrobia bacterium]